LYSHYGRDIQLSELDDALAADHLAWLKQNQKLAHCSINNGHRCTLFAVWRFAVELGLMDRDPRIRKLKELRHEPDSWDLPDVKRLVEATSIYAGQEWAGVVPKDAFWRAALLVEWWTALRIGSLFKIRQDNVNLQTGWLYVEPKTVKTGRGKKFRLGADAIEAVKAIWSPRRELLLPWPYRREVVWRHFLRIQRAAGVPDCSRAMQRFHKLRRTVATQAAIHAGMPAAIALLDHSGPEITRRYLDPSKMPGCDATEFLPKLNVDLNGHGKAVPQ
jgi:integrase